MKKLFFLLVFTVCNISSIYAGKDIYVLGINYYTNYYNAWLTSVDRSYFNSINSTTVIIPQSIISASTYPVMYIDESAFRSEDWITNVSIGSNVERIEKQAFENCTSLETVTFGKKLEYIGNNSFNMCISLKSIELPFSLTYIDDYAFSNCIHLSSVTVNSPTPLNINSTVFNNVDLSKCILLVPEQSVETYKSASVWKNFGKIRAIGSGFEVIFKDWDDSILSIQEVYEGDAAIAPTNPSREGYTFVGWDKEFTNITSDVIINAQYKINRFEVIFKDWDGNVLKSDSVDWNTAAIAPANPSREGYEFIGWDKEFSQVIENMTITAQYEFGENKTVTVIFANSNDESEILSQQLILKVPLAPEIDGFTFLGWYPVASTFAEPENTITIQAVYQPDVPSSAPEVYTNPANPAQKLIKNGNVYILSGERLYTITGQKAK